MIPTLAHSLDALSVWRTGVARILDELSHHLARHQLIEPAGTEQLRAVRSRVEADKLVVAFVAEVSRGKSELINAIFFADAGRRVLPATPGRTTMCPVELAWDNAQAPSLCLLPIQTRLEDASLAEFRERRAAWHCLPLNPNDTAQMAQSLLEVARTLRVDPAQARALGFWDDQHPQHNALPDSAGMVEVPAWRHALINHPHPLLRRGLVVLDTPGLNAVGVEPELTLGLLPAAQATVFIIAADAGVTRSDLAIWGEYLSTPVLDRFVVLNKIDTLLDPMANAAQVEAQIESQRLSTAHTLGVVPGRVYPVSARQALAARVADDAQALARSGICELEGALAAQLLPQRRQLLERMVLEIAALLETQVRRRVGEVRRHVAEQTLELRGLRGKSSARLRLLQQRIEVESRDFERCTVRLNALRAVHQRLRQALLAQLSSARLRVEVSTMQAEAHASLLGWGARKAFVALCGRLSERLLTAAALRSELNAMLTVSFARLNAEFGFSLALSVGPDPHDALRELDLIEANYASHLGVSHALRLSNPRFIDDFRRMLLTRLTAVFDTARAEQEAWMRSTSLQMETQLHERRRYFLQRHETLERVRAAAGDLERSIVEIETKDSELQQHLAHALALTERMREQARAVPAIGDRVATRQPDGPTSGGQAPSGSAGVAMLSQARA